MRESSTFRLTRDTPRIRRRVRCPRQQGVDGICPRAEDLGYVGDEIPRFTVQEFSLGNPSTGNKRTKADGENRVERTVVKSAWARSNRT